jgi:hypothetical protein
MDGELSYLAVVAVVVVVVVVIVMVGLSRSAMSVVRLGTLHVNVACGLVQEVLAVEDVAAGAGATAAVPDTAGVRAIVGEVTALVTALQGAVVYPQLAVAAIAGHHSTTAAMMNLCRNGVWCQEPTWKELYLKPVPDSCFL